MSNEGHYGGERRCYRTDRLSIRRVYIALARAGDSKSESVACEWSAVELPSNRYIGTRTEAPGLLLWAHAGTVSRTDRQTDGHRTVTYTLLHILCILSLHYRR